MGNLLESALSFSLSFPSFFLQPEADLNQAEPKSSLIFLQSRFSSTGWHQLEAYEKKRFP
jgi:hypothetical protein